MFAEIFLFQAAAPAAACATGTCPNVITATSAPAVVMVQAPAPAPFKTTVQYRRNIFGQLRPVGATTVFEPVEVSAKSAKAAKGGTCKGGCK